METRLLAASYTKEVELPAPPHRHGETPHLLAPSLIAICDRESNGKQHDETPTVYKTPSLPLRPMLRAPQPSASDTVRRPLHGDAASSRVLYQGGGASSSAIATRRDAASPCTARPLTTSLTRHILPNSETPNSESNHITAVEIREAQGEVVTKPLCQPSELKKQRGQSPIFSARHRDNYTQGVRRSATDHVKRNQRESHYLTATAVTYCNM